MVNKFLVFVVFAIVTQSSVLLSSATFDGFSEEGYDLLDRFQSEDLAARAKSVIGFGWFVNLLKNGTGQTSSHEDLSPYVDALSVVVESTDIMYYSALLVSNGDCGFETALNETRDQLREVIELLISSIASAKGGKYDENRSEIEDNRNSTAPELVSAYGTLFEFLRCCISDSSEGFETLIGYVQAKVNENLHLRTDALYKAIEAYSILTSECSEDEAAAALACIDESLFIILATAIDNIEHIFSLYETSYIVTYLYCDDIAHGIFEIRLARKRTSDKLVKAIEVVFLAITGRLLAEHNHYEIGSNNSAIADPTQFIAVELLLGVDEHFLEIVLVSLPNSADYVAVAKIIMRHVLPSLIRNYYNGMDLAKADSLPYRLSLLAINALKQIQNLLTNFVVGKYFEIIGSDAKTEVRLERQQNRVMASLQAANDAVFNATEVLSKVDHANEGASEDDFKEVHSYLLTAIFAVSEATKVQFGAVLYKFLVESGY